MCVAWIRDGRAERREWDICIPGVYLSNERSPKQEMVAYTCGFSYLRAEAGGLLETLEFETPGQHNKTLSRRKRSELTREAERVLLGTHCGAVGIK